MLHIFSGNDAVTVREHAHEYIEVYEARGVHIERITSENYGTGMFQELAHSQSLFGDEVVVLIDTPSDREEMFNEFVASVKILQEAPHTFIVIEKKLLAAESKSLKKHAENYHEITNKTSNERFNTFSLADAFARRDKKSLWVLLARARIAGIIPEEIIGILFWQIKSLRLAKNTKTSEEAGMKDFPYRKAKSAEVKFSENELTGLSRDLIDVYHKGHRGEVDIETALEKFVLTL